MEGWPWVGLAFSITAATALFAGAYAVIPGMLTAWVLWFFRDPDRTHDGRPESILSPADGTVLDVTKPTRSPWIADDDIERYVRVSIFMSVFNVHVNRAPCDGRVEKIAYNAGKFLSAFKEKASLENEQSAVWVRPTGGSPILFVQIAGLIARRIVCKLKEGEPVAKAMRYGLIRFGSRMDVYLVADEVDVLVRKGEKTQAGHTVLARRKA